MPNRHSFSSTAVLSSQKSVFLVGEPIFLKLHLSNNSPKPVTLCKKFSFSWEQLKFSAPDRACLMSPQGEDLCAAYQDNAFFCNPVVIKPHSDEWLILPISAHFFLKATGAYSFYVELTDEDNCQWKSNLLEFSLADDPECLLSTKYPLKITNAKSEFYQSEQIIVECSFFNQTTNPIAFIKPQVDSLDGWCNPTYRFTVVDQNNRSLIPAQRCGNMNENKYFDDSYILVLPDSCQKISCDLLRYPEMKTPGIYRIQLLYLVRKAVIGKSGTILDRFENWPDTVFVGMLESNTISIKILP